MPQPVPSTHEHWVENSEWCFTSSSSVLRKSRKKVKNKIKISNARSYRKPASPFQAVGVSSSKPVLSTGAVALVDAAVPPESHAACSLTAVCPLSAESWETASLMREDVHDPPPPMPLLFLPLILKGSTHFALLDSGASDSFISAYMMKQAGLRIVPLKKPIRVRVANGQSLDVLHFVLVTVVVGTLHLRLFLRVITTTYRLYWGTPSCSSSTS